MARGGDWSAQVSHHYRNHQRLSITIRYNSRIGCPLTVRDELEPKANTHQIILGTFRTAIDWFMQKQSSGRQWLRYWELALHGTVCCGTKCVLTGLMFISFHAYSLSCRKLKISMGDDGVFETDEKCTPLIWLHLLTGVYVDMDEVSVWSVMETLPGGHLGTWWCWYCGALSSFFLAHCWLLIDSFSAMWCVYRAASKSCPADWRKGEKRLCTLCVFCGWLPRCVWKTMGEQHTPFVYLWVICSCCWFARYWLVSQITVFMMSLGVKAVLTIHGYCSSLPSLH